MKKLLSTLILATVLCTVLLIFSACSPVELSNGNEATYKISYTDNGNILFEKNIPQGKKAEEYIPKKEHYGFLYWTLNGLPYDYAPVTENITLCAVWEAKQYNVRFVNGNRLIATRAYTVENKNIELPTVPEKKDYTGKWDDFELNGGNITVNAIYTPIDYKIYFYGPEGLCDVRTYNVENYTVNEPEVPAIEYYDGKWEQYTLVSGDIKVNAVYTPTVYRINFYADGKLVNFREYTCANKTIIPPEVPDKRHYTGIWEEFNLNFGNINVNAIYTPVEYEIYFCVNGQILQTQTYTVENMNVAEPIVPKREHYDGIWENYALNFENITVNAIYSPVVYYVSFYVEDRLYATRTYTVENRVIDEPLCPEKENYIGSWAPYLLEGGDLRIDAIYKLQDTEPTNGLIYTLNDDGETYSVTGYSESDLPSEIVIPANYKGISVTAVGNNAFSSQNNLKKITVCNGVQKIGDYAFQSCSNLAEVKLPDTVTEIGVGAFTSCIFSEFKLPNNLTVISRRAFQQCDNLESIIIPDSVTKIDNWAFFNCKSLKSAIIGSGVTEIGMNAFIESPLITVEFKDAEGWARYETPETPSQFTVDFTSPENAARILGNGASCYYFKEN